MTINIPQDLSNKFITYTCTREQLIKDGDLVDISKAAQEAGLNLPVAITRAAWLDCVDWKKKSTDSEKRKNESTRLWDVVWMCRCGIAGITGRRICDDTVLFQLCRVTNGGYGKDFAETTLKAIIGPGDNGEPVLTIMLPHED